jgi:hypothetical protein
MNDEFLSRLRKPPRRSFAEALYAKISTSQRSQTMFATYFKRLGWALAVLSLILALTLAISPTARAAALTLVHDIGGLIFNETDHFDTEALPPGITGSYTLISNEPPDGEHLEVLDTEIVSLEEARSRLGYAFGLPGWLPDGFIQNAEIRYLIPDGQVFQQPLACLRWENASPSAALDLCIQYPAQTDIQYVIGQGGVDEVQVSGQPAALQKGAWDLETKQWVETDLVILMWARDGATYQFSADSTVVSVDALIQMAESIP